MALDADASITSPSVMPPTALCMIFTFIVSAGSLPSISFTASTEPWTSPFTTTLRSFTAPSLIFSYSSARLIFAVFLISDSCFFLSLMPAICFAVTSSLTTVNTSPASGTPESPNISTGMAGPASSTFLPQSLIIALTLPQCTPLTNASPIFTVPSCTKTVATGPRPLSSFASIIAPFAGLFGLTFNSSISA